MNYVRYLAMRQRKPGESQPPLKYLVRRLKEIFTGTRMHEEEVAAAETGVQLIPDEVLVALSALQHLNPECLSELPGPASSPDKLWPRALDRESPFWTLFEKARNEHEAKFGNWSSLAQYRERFLEMTANVQVR